MGKMGCAKDDYDLFGRHNQSEKYPPFLMEKCEKYPLMKNAPPTGAFFAEATLLGLFEGNFSKFRGRSIKESVEKTFWAGKQLNQVGIHFAAGQETQLTGLVDGRDALRESAAACDAQFVVNLDYLVLDAFV